MTWQWRAQHPFKVSAKWLPWGVLAVLCLLRPNRCWQHWLVWLPVGAAGLLAAGAGKAEVLGDEPFGTFVRAFPSALAVSWAAALLLAPWVGRNRGFWASWLLLATMGAFALLTLALAPTWDRDGISELISGVTLQFLVLGQVAALRCAGWSVRRRFTLPRFSGWFVGWVLVIWVGLLGPVIVLMLTGNPEVVPGLLGVGGVCVAATLIVSGLFLALAGFSREYRQRLAELALPADHKAGGGAQRVLVPGSLASSVT